MLNIQNKQMKLSEYRRLYDLVIPKDNLLRKIKENIDFSFVNKMLKESYCEYYGRPAEEPEMMFKLLFLKRMYDLSDEVLMDNTRYNMAYKYFLDLDPEDEVICPSLLTKFRKTRINKENMLEEMLAETIKQAISKGIIKSNAIIVDATHSESKTNQETPTQMLRRVSKELRKEIYKNRFELSEIFPEKPAETSTLDEEIEYTKKLIESIETDISIKDVKIIQDKFNKLKELLKSDKIKEIQSVVDEDAKKGYKSETNSFFGYKSHIAMTEERIITAIEVTSGEAPDGECLPALIEKSKNNGINVEEVIGDTAYSGKRNLDYMNEKGIKAISRLHPVISNGFRTENEKFEFIKDAGMFKCPAGHLSIRKAKQGKKGENSNQVTTYYFDINKCKDCKFKDGCYKGGKSKTYSVSILSSTHKQQQDFESTEYFKSRIKQRYMVEAKNAEMKQAHGLSKCKYVGLSGMRMQIHFTAFVTNIKRIIKIMELKSILSSYSSICFG